MNGARVAAVAAGGLLVVAGGWLHGMRDKGSSLVGAQRRFNRDHVNPRQHGTAGTAGAGTALVRHTGRRSGRTYETPVDVVPTPDGFVVSMVYGRQTDWVRNLLAGGPGAVVHDGSEHPVVTAEVTGVDEVAEVFTPAQRRLMRVFGVTEAMVIRTSPPAG